MWVSFGGDTDKEGSEGHNGTAIIAARIAVELWWQRGRILATYELTLRRAGSPLVNDPVSRRQCLDHAERILADAVASLAREHPLAVADSEGLARGIGVARATNRVHPSESLRAAGELFTVIMDAARGLFEMHGAPPGIVVTFSVALNASIGRRIREASSEYAGFLMQKIQETYVDERRRIAREIHDRVAQNVAVAQQSLELYSVYVEGDPVRAEMRINTAQQALSQTINSIRGVTSDLRLTSPVEGLHKALEDYLESVRTGNIQVGVTVNGEESWASADVRDQAFLVVREALRNAIAHANPRAVMVQVDIAPHELRATIEDDGVGMDSEPIRRSAVGGGLASMRERAALLGGGVTMVSRPRFGTRIELLVPLERRVDGHGG